MTPFGTKMRELRAEKGITLKQMAKDVGVSSAYLSALEHGHRGTPGWMTLQRIIAYFNLIWDDAEDMVALAQSSEPKPVIDTSGLSPKATQLANMLAVNISDLSDESLERVINALMQEVSGEETL
ncbi:MAG: helix-turn-helix domain-containing protein, partial [Hyphomicrobiales bacterium]